MATVTTMPNFLVWDMDGTPIDSASVVPDAFVEAVRIFGGTVHNRNEIVRLYSLGPPRVILDRLLDRPCGQTELDAYHRVLAQEADAVTACAGIADALAALHGSVPMAVFTGASHRAAEILLRAAGLARYFTIVVGGDQVPRPKPDLAGILLACAQLGAEPARTVYIGDAPTDLLAARNAGVIAAAAGWGHLYSPQMKPDVLLEVPDAVPQLFS